MKQQGRLISKQWNVLPWVLVRIVMQEPQWDVSPWCRRLLIKWIIGNWEHKGSGDKVIRPVTLPWWGDITITSTGLMTWSPATRRYTPAKVKVGVTFNLNPKYLSVLSDVLLYDTRGESFVLQMVIWSYSGHPHLRSGHWYSISNFQTHLYFCSDAIKIDQQDFNTRLLSLRPMAPLSLYVYSGKKIEFTKNILNFTLSLSASDSI